MSIYPVSIPFVAHVGRATARGYLVELANVYADSVREHAVAIITWRALYAERRALAAATQCPRLRALYTRSACRAAAYIGASIRDMRRAAAGYNDVRAVLATIPNG